MHIEDEKDQRALLEKYLKDPTKKLLWKDIKNPDFKRYEFLVSTVESPDEVRDSLALFFDDGKSVRLSRSTSKHQKFLCIGGPFDGQKMLEENANEYVSFNRSSSRDKRDKKVPSVILVFRKSLIR